MMGVGVCEVCKLGFKLNGGGDCIFIGDHCLAVNLDDNCTHCEEYFGVNTAAQSS